MISHGFSQENKARGQNIKIGLLDDPSSPYHYNLMMSWFNVISPNAQIIQGMPGYASEITRLAGLGCSIIAMPWIIPGISEGQYPDMDAALTTTAQDVQLFGAVGDGYPNTGYPASHHAVWSCGAVNGDGSPNARGTTTSGNCFLAAICGSSSEASVMCAAMCAMWMVYASYTHSNPRTRHNGFYHWIGDTGIATQRGNAPWVGTL